METPSKRIFLSYTHRDVYVSFALQLKSDLEEKGYEFWIDSERLKPGVDWDKCIEDGLEWTSTAGTNGHLVLVMTPQSVRRPDGFCLNEIARAVERKLHIVPVLLADCDLPLTICRLQYLDMKDCFPVEARNPRYLDKVGKLVQALENPTLDLLGAQSRLLASVRPLDFGAEVRGHCGKFIGREGFKADIERWLADDAGSKVYWLTGLPGTGKTALAAWLSVHKPEVAAIHFCRFANVYTCDGGTTVRSLAYQLSMQIPDYQASLLLTDFAGLDKAAGNDPDTLCDELIVKKLPTYAARKLMIIDALDEATVGKSNALAKLIKTHLLRTPDWLRILVTSRPEPAIQFELQAFTPKVLDTASKENQADARAYIHKNFALYADSGGVPEDNVRTILERSEGNFLYLVWLGAELAQKRMTICEADAFPRGLGEAYSQFFDRQFPDTDKYDSEVRPVVATILAAREPLEVGFLAMLFQWTTLPERKQRLSALGSMFVENMHRCQAFHKSLLEWITADNSGPYQIDPMDGERLLADRGWAIFQHDPVSAPVYLAKHLVSHVAVTGRKDLDGSRLLLNFAWMQKKLAATDVFSLIADFELLSLTAGESSGLVESAVQLSAPALMTDKAQLPGQLLGRLMSFSQPEIRALLEQACAWQGQLWLRPLSADLVPPGTTLLATLDEPGGGVATVAVSDDGKTVAFAVHDQPNSIPPAVRVWRVSGETFTVSNIGASALALSADGSVLAVAADDSTILLWSMGKERPRYSFSSKPGVGGLVFVNSNRLMAITSAGELQTWDLGSAGGTLVSTAWLDNAFQESTFSKTLTVALAHRARRLFTGVGFMSAESLSEWDLDGALKTRHERPKGWSALAVTPDADTLVIGNLEIEIWTRLGEQFQWSRTLPGHGFVINALAATPDGARVVSSTYHEIKLWDSRPSRPNPTATRGADYVDSLAIRADGKEALAKYRGGAWKTIDIRTQTASLAPTLPAEATLLGRSYEESSLILGLANDILFWNTATGQSTRVVGSPIEGSPVAITDDRKRAVTVLKGQQQHVVWDVDTRAILSRMEGRLNAIALFPDGSCLAGSIDHSVRVWDVESGTMLRTLVGPTWYVDCLAAGVTPQGLRIISGARDKFVRVWDPHRAQPLLTLAGHTYTISDVRFLPGGEWFVSAAGDNCIRVWNISTGRCEAVYTADAWMLQCIPTPDGKLILAGDMSGEWHFLELAGTQPKFATN